MRTTEDRLTRLENKVDQLNSNLTRVEVEMERRFAQIDNSINYLRVTQAELRQSVDAGFRQMEARLNQILNLLEQENQDSSD